MYFVRRAHLRVDQAALLAGCGNTLWVRVNFTGLRVLDNRGAPCRMLKMAVQQGRSERRGEAYPCGTLSL
jgi:hypothetical protein